MTKQDVLDACIIDEKVVRLPNQLDRKLYVDVAKALEGIGGKWNRKQQGFLFPHDPSELLGRVREGEKINLKKEYQFYSTPPDLARYLVELADIHSDDHILEPSAGQGYLLDIILEYPCAHLECCELMPQNQQILQEKGYLVRAADFLSYLPERRYSKIIANPPFANNQDITHVQHMYRLLARGGRLVSILSNHWKFCQNRQEEAFRQWLSCVPHIGEQIEPGRFKESGTMVGACILVIDKPLTAHK